MRMLVAFLAADSELLELHVLNKAAAWAAGGDNPMIHTEILFVDRETEDGFVGRSCSIHYGGEVFFQQKKFSRRINLDRSRIFFALKKFNIDPNHDLPGKVLQVIGSDGKNTVVQSLKSILIGNKKNLSLIHI